ncbi:hypothetical protein T265_13757 [Opisthorchis viverrini]|uniref:Uncharacterized protein n=1 Tax=Opisthorchis viverrini TaxID=6198 RepID=A0A075AFD9_OPIVI|nr:hypothetical protein T265_13757 [Opisthorchis viverrini]KER27624.1 hypothetical protein T265_13757 [Opisthorchis viverrini]
MAQWLEDGFTDRRVCGSNPNSVSRLPLSMLGQPAALAFLRVYRDPGMFAFCALDVISVPPSHHLIMKLYSDDGPTAVCENARDELSLTDWKFRGSNPTSASRLPLSRLGRPGSIPALVPSSCGLAARHRKGTTAGPPAHSDTMLTITLLTAVRSPLGETLLADHKRLRGSASDCILYSSGPAQNDREQGLRLAVAGDITVNNTIIPVMHTGT